MAATTQFYVSPPSSVVVPTTTLPLAPLALPALPPSPVLTAPPQFVTTPVRQIPTPPPGAATPLGATIPIALPPGPILTTPPQQFLSNQVVSIVPPPLVISPQLPVATTFVTSPPHIIQGGNTPHPSVVPIMAGSPTPTVRSIVVAAPTMLQPLAPVEALSVPIVRAGTGQPVGVVTNIVRVTSPELVRAGTAPAVLRGDVGKFAFNALVEEDNRRNLTIANKPEAIAKIKEFHDHQRRIEEAYFQ